MPPSPAGAGRYAIDLATALAPRDDVDVTFVARRGDSERWVGLAPRGDIHAVAPGSRPARLAWEQARLPRLLRKLPVEVHHSPHYTMPESAGIPTVVTVHDLTFFDHPEWHERSKVPVFRRATRVASRHAAALICVSQATADRLVALCPPQGKVHVIPHGVALDRFSPVPAGDEAVLGHLGVRPPYVAFVGTLEPRKDLPTLVHAFERVASAHPDLSLVLAGYDGWGNKSLDRAIGESTCGDRIVRTGYLPDSVVPALLRQAAAVAYPSLEEGFGLPALEALACGAPLVTTAGSVMEEVVAGAALLVEPGDTDALAGVIDMLVRGDAGFEARRQRGLAVAARHTWAASAAAHIAVYRSVAGT
ncbi:MAG TPA: glycosyltransferase family 1 protein [Acidimicrobiales bacterium]|nr:glycosyltransferase family 1 protein [Acidimicrobiales bacterium]